jgi:mercuric ion transport protein
MATQDRTTPSASSADRHDAAKMICAGGGLLAAFGVASCCALPIALSMLGISAASLVGIGYFAAQYQQELFFAAVLLLGGTAAIMWRQRRALAGQSGVHCGRRRPMLDWGSGIALALALGLLVLTFWIEPPV